MKCFVGLGSNLGNRRENLETAVRRLQTRSSQKIQVSPLFETSALVPAGAPEDWNRPFLNAALEMEWESGAAQDLLSFLKSIEAECGRTPSAKWAPRILDLDLLLFGEEIIHTPELKVPHAEMWNRSFVLAPLKHLKPNLQIPGFSKSVLQRCRELPVQSPVWMTIFNLTPDSFSDGGELRSEDLISQKLQQCEQENIQILDLGAESTRPGAQLLTPKEEWARLLPTMNRIVETRKNRFFAPLVSVDTYHAQTAARALEMGANLINDVSGLQDPEMIDILKSGTCDYILMHSKSVPAVAGDRLEAEDVVVALKQWLTTKLEMLDQQGIDLNRIIFDPGIGFGKSKEQSITLLKRIDEFHELPVRTLVGHSRKSFLNFFGERPASERDPETLGISLQLARRGVDILRIHEPSLHLRSWRAFQEIL